MAGRWQLSVQHRVKVVCVWFRYRVNHENPVTRSTGQASGGGNPAVTVQCEGSIFSLRHTANGYGGNVSIGDAWWLITPASGTLLTWQYSLWLYCFCWRLWSCLSLW